MKTTYLTVLKVYAIPRRLHNMDSSHFLMLTLLYQVVTHSCSGISEPRSLGLPDSLEDDEQKYGDIKNVLHVIPYPEMLKWKSNLSRILPEIKKNNASPIAIILAPSNIASKFHQRQMLPGMGGILQHPIDTHARGIHVSKEELLKKENADARESEDLKRHSIENFAFKPSHNLNEEKEKLSEIKSHEYTHFVLDENTLNNRHDNDESRYKMTPTTTEKEMDSSELHEESKTDDITTVENNQNDIVQHLSKAPVALDSDKDGDIIHHMNIETDSISGENIEIVHNPVEKQKTDKLIDQFKKDFYPSIECIRTDGKHHYQNGTYSINFLFHFHI